MRIEFDKQGYVSCILYGCSSGSCVEYTGLVPTQPKEYADIDDWAENAQTRAYYLDVQGNLIYDAERAAELEGLVGVSPHVYSSDETMTEKTWIDGKPIFRKVFSVSAISKGGVGQVDISSISSTFNMVSMTGMGVSSDGRVVLPSVNRDKTYEIGVNFGNDDTMVNIWCGSSISLTKGHIILEYTK